MKWFILICVSIALYGLLFVLCLYLSFISLKFYKHVYYYSFIRVIQAKLL